MIELTVNNLHLHYGDNPVLKGVTMQLKKGEVVSLLGPSGSGKTTLLRAVAGLEEVHSGLIQIGERVVYDSEKRLEVSAEERNLGLVFQSYALWPHKTVYDNIAYPLQLRKVSAVQIKDRIQNIAEHLGLAHLLARFPHALSGGQQQRVAIARALVYNPPIILLDEPLSNLDAKLREEARVFLRELILSLNLSALMVTHDQAEAMAISDRILLLNNGKIEQEGTPEEMYSNPHSLFTAEFMGSNNRLAGKIKEIQGEYALVEGEGWSIWGKIGSEFINRLQSNSDVVAVIRVERVRLAESSQENTLEMPLVTSMYLGDRWESLLRFNNPSYAPLSLRVFSPQRLSEGSYTVQLPKEAVWIYGA